MVTLKYIGVIATTFNGIGEVAPQGTFEVDDEHVGAYTRRADIVRLDAEPEPEPEQQPTATDAE